MILADLKRHLPFVAAVVHTVMTVAVDVAAVPSFVVGMGCREALGLLDSGWRVDSIRLALWQPVEVVVVVVLDPTYPMGSCSQPGSLLVPAVSFSRLKARSYHY